MQEQELTLWGISKVLRRNIIVGFIVIELAATVVLADAYVRQSREKDGLNKEIIKCKEEYAKAYDDFRKEQVSKLEAALEKQAQIERELRRANEKLNRR